MRIAANQKILNERSRKTGVRVEDLKRKPKPKWLRAKLPTQEAYGRLKSVLQAQGLNTVCQEAGCPNQTECWESRTATFLLMGHLCTRHCRFCDVQTGRGDQILDLKEPKRLAQAVKELGLKYVVLTSVTRDDLSDGGAAHLSQCIQIIRETNPDVPIEILIPDFQGDRKAVQTIVTSAPEVIGHNVETVEALTPQVRDKRATYQQSLRVLKQIKEFNPQILTKSSIMLGLGETEDQVKTTLQDLRAIDVDIVTLGQYLQPSRRHLDVVEYIAPQKFEEWEKMALEMGFLFVVSGPLVRSSYRAGELFVKHHLHRKSQSQAS